MLVCLHVGTGKNSATPLYNKTRNPEKSHAHIGYASIYNVKTFNDFNPELKLINAESVTINKLKYLITEMRGFKFIRTLV